jgi:hypothetical protein
VFASERIVGIGDVVDRRIWMLLRDSFDRCMRLVSQSAPG